MQNIEKLMHLMPLDALREMIATRIKPPLKAEYFTFSRPVSVFGALTRVRCTFDRTLAPVNLWHYEGSFDFDYYRMPLASFNLPTLRAYGKAPFNSRELFRSCIGQYKIPTDRADIIDEELPGYGTKILRAGLGSYRWIGAVSVQALEFLKNLSDYVLNRELSILNMLDIDSAGVPAALVDRMNTENHITLTVPLAAANMTFGIPEAIGPLALSANTRIEVSTTGPNYTGSVEITYSRQSFEGSWAIPLVVPDGEYTSTAAMAPMIEQLTGYKVRPEDILDEDPAELGARNVILVRFKPESLGFIGDVLMVTESWDGWDGWDPVVPPGSPRYWIGNWTGDWIDQWT